MEFSITIENGIKQFKSSEYNYTFNLKNGDMAVWGKTEDETPTKNPFGPEIADIEITNICHGPNGIPCNFCYKSNTPDGTNMSFETFKAVLNKFPTDKNKNHILNQIAFGVDAHATSNPDLWKMMKYCREHNIIPNLTVADISKDTAKKILEIAGACSVSAYKHAKNFEICFDSIQKLTDAFFESKNTSREKFESIFKDVASVAYKKMN